MRVLLAFDKFKHTLGAAEACATAAAAIHEAFPNAHTDEAPLTDGGEGFCEILTHAAGGHVHQQPVQGPRLEKVIALWGEVDLARLPQPALDLLDLPNQGKLAVIEMAQASGLNLLAQEQRDPWHTTSFGVGELIGRAAEVHCRAILLGLGGSATNDLGLGALEAVGLEFRDAVGAPLHKITPAKFADIVRFAGEPWPHLPDLRLACDVRNPLLGPNGATAIFAPQKGLADGDFARLEKTVGAMAKKLCAHFDQPHTLMMEPGTGAAGGLGFGLRVACAAKLTPGFGLISSWLKLEERIRSADLVLTGEGAFDASSLSGKAVGALAELAFKHHKKIAVFAGRVDDATAASLRTRAPEGRVQLHAISILNETTEVSHRATRARLAAKIKAVF